MHVARRARSSSRVGFWDSLSASLRLLGKMREAYAETCPEVVCRRGSCVWYARVRENVTSPARADAVSGIRGRAKIYFRASRAPRFRESASNNDNVCNQSQRQATIKCAITNFFVCAYVGAPPLTCVWPLSDIRKGWNDLAGLCVAGPEYSGSLC